MNAPRDPRVGLAVYNPGLLSRDELLETFCGRDDVVGRLLDDLRENAAGGSPQHHLLLGSRGIGKTTLLHRLGFAVEDEPALAGRLLPLRFPEEQWNVADLSGFWANCLDALADLLERRGEVAAVAALDRIVQELPDEAGPRAEAGRSELLREARRLGKSLLLLLDNVDVVLGRLSEEELWTLRGALTEDAGLLLVGATTDLTGIAADYDAPFHDFFRVHELEPLEREPARDLLLRLADARGLARVRERLDADPGGFAALHALSGGSPRALVFLLEVLAVGGADEVAGQLERLLDLCTPFYKARFEELPAQAQQALDALALLHAPSTAAQVSARARLDINATSSQLARLQRSGWVEVVDLPGKARHGFQVAERLFNIWYLMRASRRERRRVVWLAEFLRDFYGPDGLLAQARRIVLEGERASALLAGALAEAMPENGLARLLAERCADLWRDAPGEEEPGDRTEQVIRMRQDRDVALMLARERGGPRSLDRQTLADLLGSPAFTWKAKAHVLASADSEDVSAALFLAGLFGAGLDGHSRQAQAARLRDHVQAGRLDGWRDEPGWAALSLREPDMTPEGLRFPELQLFLTCASVLDARAARRSLAAVSGELETLVAGVLGDVEAFPLPLRLLCLTAFAAAGVPDMARNAWTSAVSGDAAASVVLTLSAAGCPRRALSAAGARPLDWLMEVAIAMAAAAAGDPETVEAVVGAEGHPSGAGFRNQLLAAARGDPSPLFALPPEERRPALDLLRTLRPDVPIEPPRRRRERRRASSPR